METYKHLQRIKINFREEIILLADFVIPWFTVAYIPMSLFHMIGLQP